MYAFKTSNEKIIPAPVDFEHLSGFFKGYTDTYSNERAGQASPDEDAAVIHLPSIESRHLRQIVAFLQLLRDNSPLEYTCALQGAMDKVERIPEWAEKFFTSLKSSDLIGAANAASFLDVPAFIEHVFAYLIFKAETSSVEEMRKLLGSEADFQGAPGERLTKEKAWKPTMNSRPSKKVVVGKLYDYSTADTTY